MWLDPSTEQDAHLETLTRSVTAQRDLSIQINTELDEHNELLEDLGGGVDRTSSRLSDARKRLDRFSRGVKGNCECIQYCLMAKL